MKTLKTLLILLVLSTSVHADFLSDIGDWAGGAFVTIINATDPCTGVGNKKSWWETPSDGSGRVCRCDNGVL